MSDINDLDEPDRPVRPRSVGDESGIIVFGGGRGCAGRGCLFWIVLSIVLSVVLTIVVNLVLVLFSGGGSGVGL